MAISALRDVKGVQIGVNANNFEVLYLNLLYFNRFFLLITCEIFCLHFSSRVDLAFMVSDIV